MDFITRLALQNRLLHFLLVSITVCFIVVSTFHAHFSREDYRQKLNAELHNVADLITGNIGGALLYGADWVADEVLQRGLSRNRSVQQAVLFSADGTAYSSYNSSVAEAPGLPEFRLSGHFDRGEFREYYFPVFVGDNREASGVLYLRADLQVIEGLMEKFWQTQLIILSGILLLTWGIGHKLQQVIGEPWRQQQKMLEGKVAERTAELQQAHDQLSNEVAERKAVEQNLRLEKEQHLELISQLEQTQNQLLQSEKMASIGQLAAGVAHEINNPVGFISSNLNSLRGYTEGLVELIRAYERADGVLSEHPELAASINGTRERVDFRFLVEDIDELLQESQDGVERVRTIVRDLRDFSRSGSRELSRCDLYQGIRSTLNVAANELKYKARVETEYAELPEVVCCISQINQVLLNLLVNAAQAIEEQGIIWLRTGYQDERVWIEVEDNGRGIPREYVSRVFDPFFTTKPVGKGTGLGLSLSWGIIRDHGGELEVDSEEGRGTRFRIWLPVEGPQALMAQA